MLIVAAIAVTAAPRLSGTDIFSVNSARDLALSVARQIQLRAMQQEPQVKTSSALCHSLVITASRLGGSDNAACNRQDDANRTDVMNLTGSGIAISVSQIGASSVSLPLDIYFNLLGRPVNNVGVRLCNVNQCKITFSKSGTTSSLCLNGEGYFYACSA